MYSFLLKMKEWLLELSYRALVPTFSVSWSYSFLLIERSALWLDGFDVSLKAVSADSVSQLQLPHLPAMDALPLLHEYSALATSPSKAASKVSTSTTAFQIVTTMYAGNTSLLMSSPNPNTPGQELASSSSRIPSPRAAGSRSFCSFSSLPSLTGPTACS